MENKRNSSVDNRKKRIKRKKQNSNRLNIFLLLSTFIILLLLFSYIRQRTVIARLMDQSNALALKQEETNKKIDDLIISIQNSNSLEYIEKVAREELGMIKSDEKIYVDGEESNNSEESDQETESKTKDNSDDSTESN